MAINITSDNFEEYFNQALISKGADAIEDDTAQGGIAEITENGISKDFLMLLLDKTSGSEVWKKAKLEELAKKIDALTSLLHDATLVQSLPTASAETMGRIYLMPAALQATALWDWANGVPAGLRDVVISGVDESGTLPSDNDTYRIGIGPEEEGDNVECYVLQSSDTFVSIGSHVVIEIPVAVAGDVITINFAEDTAANCTFGGTALSGDTFTHTVTAEEAVAGRITLITTDTVEITSIGAIYLANSKAQGFDPQHTQCDKYITIADTTSGTTVYRWEQIGSAYINMTNYYDKQGTNDLVTGLIQALLEDDNTFTGNNIHEGSDVWTGTSSPGDLLSISNSLIRFAKNTQTFSRYTELQNGSLYFWNRSRFSLENKSATLAADGLTLRREGEESTLTKALIDKITDTPAQDDILETITEAELDEIFPLT